MTGSLTLTMHNYLIHLVLITNMYPTITSNSVISKEIILPLKMGPSPVPLNSCRIVLPSTLFYKTAESHFPPSSHQSVFQISWVCSLLSLWQLIISFPHLASCSSLALRLAVCLQSHFPQTAPQPCHQNDFRNTNHVATTSNLSVAL